MVFTGTLHYQNDRSSSTSDTSNIFNKMTANVSNWVTNSSSYFMFNGSIHRHKLVLYNHIIISNSVITFSFISIDYIHIAIFIGLYLGDLHPSRMIHSDEGYNITPSIQGELTGGIK